MSARVNVFMYRLCWLKVMMRTLHPMANKKKIWIRFWILLGRDRSGRSTQIDCSTIVYAMYIYIIYIYIYIYCCAQYCDTILIIHVNVVYIIIYIYYVVS